MNRDLTNLSSCKLEGKLFYSLSWGILGKFARIKKLHFDEPFLLGYTIYRYMHRL